ncbi:MAG: ATP-binding protein [Eubacterium sp.]|nr:ATP-binding protein [Eubacterium sp.]
MYINEVSSRLITGVTIYCGFIVLVMMFLLAKTISSKLSVKNNVVCTAQLLLFVFIYEVLLKYLHRGDMAFWGSFLSGVFMKIPFVTVIIIEIAFTVFLICEWYSISKKEKNRLSVLSVQNGIDSMPDGLAFATPDGIPLLVNSSMYRIIHSAFKSDYFDVNKLTEYYKNGEFKKGTEIVSIKGNRFLKLSDNTVWKIVENNLTVNAKPIHEVIAYNTTGLYNKYVELDMRNRHLEEVNRRLREYIDNVYTTIREDEILAAKIRVHDDVGRTLLALRSYISHENGDRNQLLELWNFTVSVLKRENVSTDCETTLDSLIKAGGAVGVSLEFDGDLPESERYGGLINHAIHECLTNTVKHADGTLLSIKTIYENGEYRIEFTNNGKSPLVPIRETGGLKNLRNEAESCGAKMNTETKPRFKLILSFKEV